MLTGTIDMIYGKPAEAPAPVRVQVKITDANTLETACRERGLLNKFELKVYRQSSGRELLGIDREPNGFNYRLIGWYSNEAADWVELEPSEALIVVSTLKQ